MTTSRDKLCAHQIMGQLHEYRWTVEIIVREFFMEYTARYIMEYACDEPRLIFAIQNFTGGLVSGSATLCKTLAESKSYHKGENLIILKGRFGNEYVLDPGMDVWNMLFWHVLPDGLTKLNPRHVCPIIVDTWSNDIDKIKCILYDMPQPVPIRADPHFNAYTYNCFGGHDSDDSELEGAFDLFPDEQDTADA